MRLFSIFFGCMVSVCCLLGSTALAQRTVRIDFTNLNNSDHLITPGLFIFHQQSYRIATVGQRASTAVRQVAENGRTARLASQIFSNEVAATVIAGLDFTNFPNIGETPRVIAPGQTVTARVSVSPNTTPFFSYIAKMVPSSDTFISNTAQRHRVFNSRGGINASSGVFEIVIRGFNLLDAGSQANERFNVNFVTSRQASFSPLNGTERANIREAFTMRPNLNTHRGLTVQRFNDGSGGRRINRPLTPSERVARIRIRFDN